MVVQQVTGPDWVSSPFDVADAPDFDVPNWQGEDGGERPKEPPKTMRERLQSLSKSKDTGSARNVKLPKQKPPVPNVPGQFVEPVEDLYTMVAMALMPFKPEVSMTLLMPAKEATEELPDPPTVARNCAVAWDEVAQRNESVRRVLNNLTTAGVYGALFAAHMPLISVAMRGTPLAAKFDPAAAMEKMLREQAGEQDE